MLISNLPLLGAVTTWLTPIWLITLGITLGLAILFALYGLMCLVWRAGAAQAPMVVKDGILQPLLWIGLFLAAFTLVGSLQMPVRSLWESARRVFAVGTEKLVVEIPATQRDYPVEIEFRGEELKAFNLSSDQDIIVGAEIDGETIDTVVDVHGAEPSAWQKQAPSEMPFPGYVSKLFVTNYSDLPATLTATFRTGVEYPQVFSTIITAVLVVGFVALYFLIQFLAPKISVIAATTSRQAIGQPIFYLVLGIGAFLLLAFIYVPYNTFGEDVKMLKDSGLTLIMILAIIVALWTASVSVAEEIEGRTALMLLSKPVSRRQFILGKFLGIIWPVVLLFVVLGLFFLFTVSFKVVYDARESAAQAPDWQACYAEIANVAPGLFLAFLETVVLASISVAISTRLSMLANLVICSTVYVVGNLVTMVASSRAADFPLVRFAGRLIATLFPVLDYFNVQSKVAGGAVVPLEYLSYALLYCILYCTVAMLLALTLFEDRDLA